VEGTGDAGGMVTIDGLTPSTQYSIQVAAVNSNVSTELAAASLSVNTSSEPVLIIDIIGLSDAIAGQTINLTCTVSQGPNVSKTPDIQWLGPGVNLLLSGSGGNMVDNTTMVNSSTFSRTLRFTPARTSHGGLYTCQAVADSVTVTEAINLTVQSKC